MTMLRYAFSSPIQFLVRVLYKNHRLVMLGLATQSKSSERLDDQNVGTLLSQKTTKEPQLMMSTLCCTPVQAQKFSRVDRLLVCWDSSYQPT